MAGYNEGHRRLFESLDPGEMEVIDFNLEDAFIEYTRGPRRSLPVFVEEEASHV